MNLVQKEQITARVARGTDPTSPPGRAKRLLSTSPFDQRRKPLDPIKLLLAPQMLVAEIKISTQARAQTESTPEPRRYDRKRLKISTEVVNTITRNKGHQAYGMPISKTAHAYKTMTFIDEEHE